MRMSSLKTAGTLLLAWSFLTTSGYGCKYSVRDVSFVDLDRNNYTLYCYTDSAVPKEVARKFQRMCYSQLLDTNIKYEKVKVEPGSTHPALKFLEEHKITKFPTAILVSPGGESIPFAMQPREGEAYDRALLEMTDEIIGSVKREEIIGKILASYGVILFIHGKDKEQNKRVRAEIDAAVEDMNTVMSQVEKPVDVGPKVIEIPRELQKSERVLLWSLGAPDPVEEPIVHVMIGMGRRIGPRLTGGSITKPALFNILTVIGASCECGLDRSWMQGRMVPLRWSDQTRAKVSRLLNFDVENPLIKNEISRILAKGSSSLPPGQTVSEPSIEDLLFNYSEDVIEVSDSSPSPQIVAASQPAHPEKRTVEVASIAMRAPKKPIVREPQAEKNAEGGIAVGQAADPAPVRTEIEAGATDDAPSVRFSLALALIGGFVFLNLAAGAFVILRSRRDA